MLTLKLRHLTTSIVDREGKVSLPAVPSRNVSNRLLLAIKHAILYPEIRKRGVSHGKSSNKNS